MRNTRKSILKRANLRENWTKLHIKKCLTEKELEIERLNEKWRMSNLERTEEETDENISLSQPTQGFVRYPYPQSSYGPLNMPNVPPAIMCGMTWPQFSNGPIYHYPGLLEYPFPQSVRPLDGMFPPAQPPTVPHKNYPPMAEQSACTHPLCRMPNNHMEDLEQDAVEGNETCSVLDQPESQSEKLDKLDKPLTPLPAPLEPEKLPSGRIRDSLLSKSVLSTDIDDHIDSNMELKNTMSEAQQFKQPRHIGWPVSLVRTDIGEGSTGFMMHEMIFV